MTARDWTTVVAISATPIVASVLVPVRYDELFVASRLSLLGLVTGIGAMRSPASVAVRMLNGIVVGVVAVATVLTFADYERRSNDARAAHLFAQESIGEGRSVMPLVNWRPTFRVDTMSHAEGYFAAVGNQIDFGNYEVEHDYFPVRFRGTVERPSKIYGKPLESADYLDVARKVDAVLVWGASPKALTADGAFRKALECGAAQVYLSNLRVLEREAAVPIRSQCPF